MIYNANHRNRDTELMDDPAINPVELDAAVADINKINRLLGGLKFSLQAVKSLLKQHPNKSIQIVDFGCGDGRLLQYLAAHIKDEKVTFLGIDISPRSIEMAIKKNNDGRIRFRESDIKTIQKDDIQVDILISSLTLHHFNDEDIHELLIKFIEITKIAVVINDLHRHKMAFLLFKWFSRLIIKNDISYHDGMVSIASGFKRSDFERFATAVGIKNYHVNWKWSFRYIWTIPIT